MTDLYGATFERVLFPAWETVLKRRPTLRLRDYLERSQWRSVDELEATRTAELRRLLAHAYAHVPFYRARFLASGVSPEEFREPNDLRKLPLLTRDQAIESYAERASTAAPLADIRKSTGGTTGQPMQFGYDTDSEYWRQAVKLRGWGWAGYRPGVRALHYWGAPAKRPAFRQRMKITLDRAVRREEYVDCTRRSDEELEKVAERIARDPPGVLIAFTQAALDLSLYVNAQGRRRWGTIPVLCCAERLFPSDRAPIEAAFGEAVFETYGCREVMLIASECSEHAGLHLSAENLIVELIVREANGERPARPGEIGEVVITDLHNFGMPFIRYMNGDLATLSADGPCACGRNLPRLRAVEGRVAETLRDGRGGRVGGLMFNTLFTPLATKVRQFQAVQHKDGSVTLKLVALEKIDEATCQLIRTQCAERLFGVTVRTEVVPEIPLSKSGKRQVVLVER